jgi:AraC-like DNA-binding protein
MNEHLLNNHAFLVTKDLDHSREVLSSAWEHHEISVHKGWEYSVRWHQASLKRVSLSYTDSPTSLHVASSPVANTYHFGIHLSGYSSHKMNGYEALLSPDIAGLQAPGQELKFDTQPFRALLLNLDGDFVEPALRRRLGRVPPFEEWAREFAIGPGPSACLKSLCQWTAYELDQPDSWLLKSQRTAGGLEKVLRTLFLDCLEQKRPTGKRRENAAANRQVRRVEEWLDAHYADAVSIDDLAEVAGVSVRSLQAAFRLARERTPMQALHERRLRAAREALRAPEPGTTVTRVAMDCGFFHLGRFAQAYRQAFGESPSETLAGAGARAV